jgi:hypothetical protein
MSVGKGAGALVGLPEDRVIADSLERTGLAAHSDQNTLRRCKGTYISSPSLSMYREAINVGEKVGSCRVVR